MKKLKLKRGQERRILEGSLWVFSNQVESSLKDYLPGEIVSITMRNGRFLVVGYVNPHSLIACRILTLDEMEIDVQFFKERLLKAQELRSKIFPGEAAVREVFSESDGLPGLIIDRYGKILVVSINTAGMEKQRDVIIEALQDVYQPEGIFERSDSAVRKLEGLELRTDLMSGAVPDKSFWVKFAGINLPVDVKRGQKTGLYLDQRANIENTASFTKDAEVLDAFSYIGAWGLKAAKSGAVHVTFLDSSARALEQAMKAARRARVTDICDTIKGDAFEEIKRMQKKKRRFDVVFLDPPSFIQSKSRFKEGFKGYFDLNQKAISILKPGGILVTSSCSRQMEETTFSEMIKSVLRRNQRKGRILYKGRQSPDHPILPAMPETEYLHCLALQID